MTGREAVIVSNSELANSWLMSRRRVYISKLPRRLNVNSIPVYRSQLDQTFNDPLLVPTPLPPPSRSRFRPPPLVTRSINPGTLPIAPHQPNIHHHHLHHASYLYPPVLATCDQQPKVKGGRCSLWIHCGQSTQPQSNIEPEAHIALGRNRAAVRRSSIEGG